MGFKKGESPYQGERHPNAKLTDEKAREIKRRAEAGEIGAALAREFGIDPGTVSRIVSGKRWRQATTGFQSEKAVEVEGERGEE